MTAPSATLKVALPSVRILGFSGHRTVKHLSAVSEAFRNELAAIKAEGPELIAISSVAYGADTLFVREVLRAGIKWIAVLPMPRESFRDDFSPEQWIEAEVLLAQASEIRSLPGTERPQGYVDSGKETVDDSDTLITLWDGQPARGPGGTAEIVAYARSIGRKIVLFRETDSTVEKIDSGQIPAAERAPDFLLRTMGKLKDLPPLPPLPAALEAHFVAADTEANRTAPNFRRSTLRMSGYHLAATIVAGLSFAFAARNIPYPSMLFTVLKAVFVLLAFILLQKLKWSHARDIWLRQRLIAEYCRSVLATWHCRDFVEPISEYAFPEIRELARSALFLRLGKDPRAQVDAKVFRAYYAHTRVMDQYKYFEGQADGAEDEALPLRERYRAYTLAALVISVLLFVIHLILPDYSTNTYAMMPWHIRCMIVLLDMMPLVLSGHGLVRVDPHRHQGPRPPGRTLSRSPAADAHRAGRSFVLQLVGKPFAHGGETEKILFHEVLEWYSIGKFSSK